jgi:YVTN family beta-propeller protein
MTSSFARESGRFVHPFRRFISGLVAFAMATVGLVGIQVAASQPASAAGNVPVGYVVNQTAGTVTAVNLQSNATVATITVGSAPYAAVVSPDGKKVYVTNSGATTVSVITTASNTVTATFNVGTTPSGVAVSPDGTKLFVANFGSNTISILKTLDGSTVVPAVSTGAGSGPRGIAINAAGTKAYYANSTSGTLGILDPVANTVTATMTCSNMSVTLNRKVELGAALKGVAPSKADAVIATPKGGLAWWAWALIGLGVLGAFGFILMMVIRYERRRAASHKA